ncbi:MAG TPA: CxxxxCH/CxxCH domain-containing protein [Anaeromyxobacteraceae bacterium]|nr:CxxxxCH/CxxCH domain-containing protein [Anaeromyxobacteraceae bacterium]
MLARDSVLVVLAALAGLVACGDARPLQAPSGTGGGQYHQDPGWVGAGGGNHAPAALGQDPPFATCLVCHQSFGSAFAIAGTSCEDCHLQTATGAGWATTNWRQNCVFCHGDRSKLATWTTLHPPYEIAPPRGTLGETLTTSIAVGAHQRHVNPAANTLSNAVACTECHAGPLPTDIAHADGTAEVPLAGTLATAGGANPLWTRTPAPTCSATYCHGNFANGTPANAPVWTGTGQAACGTCHDLPPDTGHHYRHIFTEGRNCSNCHQGIATGSGNAAPITNGTILAGGKALHVNGAKNVVLSTGRTWDGTGWYSGCGTGVCH